jgi:hypothetical protein
MNKKRLLISLIILPGSLYFSYGPPIKKIVSNSYTKKLKQECKKNSQNENQRLMCLDSGKWILGQCQKQINALALRTKFPKCLKDSQSRLRECMQDKPMKKCINS